MVGEGNSTLRLNFPPWSRLDLHITQATPLRLTLLKDNHEARPVSFRMEIVTSLIADGLFHFASTHEPPLHAWNDHDLGF